MLYVVIYYFTVIIFSVFEIIYSEIFFVVSTSWHKILLVVSISSHQRHLTNPWLQSARSTRYTPQTTQELVSLVPPQSVPQTNLSAMKKKKKCSTSRKLEISDDDPDPSTKRRFKIRVAIRPRIKLKINKFSQILTMSLIDRT